MNYHQGVRTPKVSPLERQLNLVIALLNTPSYLTADEIRQTVAGYSADNGEAGRQMFERDKQALKDLGIPISVESTDEKGNIPGYRIIKADYQLAPLSFTSAERTVITLAMQLYAGDGYSELQSAFDKLQHDHDDTRPGLINFASAATEQELTQLTALSEAAAQHSTVTFHYHTAQALTSEEREVEPWGVVADNGHWYCVGFDRRRRAVRVFRLSRLSGDVTDTGTPAQQERPHTSVREILRQQLCSVRRYVSACVEVDADTSEELVLAADRVTTAPHDRARRHLEFDSVSYQWLRDAVLADIPHATVLEPSELAQDVRTCLERVVQRPQAGEATE